LVSSWSRALVAALLIAGATPAAAQDPSSADRPSADDERARTHFDAGRLHYDEGAYDRALIEFQRAYELSRRAILLLNLATVKERLGMHAEAADDLRAYLEAEPEDAARDRLERRITNLERLAAGEPGDPATEPAPDPEPAPAPASGPDGGLLGGAIASYAVGGAGLVVMAVLGGLAMAEDAALAAGCGASASCSDAEVADANTFALASDIGLGVGAAGVAVGTILLVVALSSGGASSAEDVSVLPWVSPEGAGLVAGGRF
jgi:tetratricopeptide (TPR) repeat protein